ncbi:Nucleolar protein 9 [Lobulomyces angularis]|nr:Nucleolar protein 9 [Lobulomyces angularis]
MSDEVQMERKKRGKRGGQKIKEKLLEQKKECKNLIQVVKDEIVLEKPKKKSRRGGKRNKSKSEENLVNTDESQNVLMEVTDEKNAGCSLKKNSRLDEKNLKKLKKTKLLNNDTRTYFLELESKLDNPEFESEEDKEIFITNLFKELQNLEINMAKDFDGSRIFEKLMIHANDFQLRILGENLFLFEDEAEDNVEPKCTLKSLFTDTYSSHVIQTFLQISSDVIHREVIGESIVEIDGSDLNLPKSMTEIVLELCNILKNDWSEIMKDQYGSHLLRVLINLLSGERMLEDSEIRSRNSRFFKLNNTSAIIKFNKSRERKVPEEFKKKLIEISSLLTKNLTHAEIKQLAIHPIASPVLQLLVLNNGLDQTFVKILLHAESSNTSFFNILMKDRVGSHLVEKIIDCANEEEFNEIFETNFKGNLKVLCLDAISNFIIQRLIANSNKHYLKIIIEEICDHFHDLFFNQRAGVVEKLVLSSGKLNISCEKVFDGLLKAFEIKSDDDFKILLGCIISLRNPTAFGNTNIIKSNMLHGSLISQHIFSFFPSEFVLKLEESFLSLPVEDILKYVKHHSLSRVVEALIKSRKTKLDTKWKLCDILLGNWCDLAKDKYASHIIEKLWQFIDVPRKTIIAKELIAKKTILENDKFGMIILRNLNVANFDFKTEEWKKKEGLVEKKRKLFQDIIGDFDNSSKNTVTAVKNDVVYAKLKAPCNQEDLNSIFKSFNPVRVSIPEHELMKVSGVVLGFAEFTDENAKSAIKELNNKKRFNGRLIEVKLDSKKESREKKLNKLGALKVNTTEKTTILTVKDYPETFNKESISNLFNKFSPTKIQMPKQSFNGKYKGYAFVHLGTKSAENAIKELNNKNIDGHLIKVGVEVSRKVGFQKNILFVKNLEKGIHSETLSKIFNKYRHKECRIPRSFKKSPVKYGFVEFVDKGIANRALSGLNGVKSALNGGQPLEISYAKTKSWRNGEPTKPKKSVETTKTTHAGKRPTRLGIGLTEKKKNVDKKEKESIKLNNVESKK